MTVGGWEDVLSQAAALGTEHVTFIGGEPTLHPALPRLVRLAVGLGLGVEIYSNMVHVSPAMWELFSLPGVSLAASWYTSDRAQHAAITGGHDTWRQTRASVARAVELGIPVRGGMVDGIVPGQRADDGERELRALGVGSIGRDRLREFGRGTVPDPSQACGHCGRGRAAVLSDGTVTPCPLTRWLRAGNVRGAPLGEIAGEPLAAAARALQAVADGCNPDCRPACLPAGLCSPRCRPNSECRPDCGPNCQPQCVPNTACRPLCAPSACKPTVK